MTSVRAARRHAFTLIELLGVMIIVTILLGITTIGLSDLGRGQGVRSAVSAFKSTVALARQHAVAHASHTYVVFLPSSADAFTGLNRFRPMAGKAYAVYAFDPATQTGQFVTKWVTLPEGLIFDTDSSRDGTVFAASAATVCPNVVLRHDSFRTSGSTVTLSLPAIRFRPTGSSFRSSGYRVYITEGWVEVNPDTQAIAYSRKPANRFEAEIGVAGISGMVSLRSYEVK